MVKSKRKKKLPTTVGYMHTKTIPPSPTWTITSTSNLDGISAANSDQIIISRSLNEIKDKISAIEIIQQSAVSIRAEMAVSFLTLMGGILFGFAMARFMAIKGL